MGTSQGQWQYNGADSGDVIVPGKATDTTALTITIPAVTGFTAFLAAFALWIKGSTLGGQLDCVISGLVGGDVTIPMTSSLLSGLTVNSYTSNIRRPLPAAAPNTAITLTIPARPAGNLGASGYLHGLYI